MAESQKWRDARPLVLKAGRLIWERYAEDPNVVGVGFGPARRGGRCEDTPVCQVYVVRKFPEDELAPERIIPRFVDVDGVRVETDVVESGPFRAHGTRGSGGDRVQRLTPTCVGTTLRDLQ
jgi:hypothetical protein